MRNYFIALAFLAGSAEATQYELIPEEKVVEKWLLTASLGAESKKFDSVSVSSTQIHGFESYEQCMKTGGAIAEELSNAVYAIGKETWNGEPLGSWSCKIEKEVMK